VKRPAGLERALRGSIDMNRLATDIRLWLARRLSDGLSLAFAARCAVIGQERMLEAMAGGGVACVAISKDISPRTVRGLKAGATSGEIFVEVPYSSAELGALLGGELYAAVAILRGPATNNVLLRLRQWSALG
jgi:ribosomal protein L7Ae-like RNA K-turn-binding protein